MNRKKFLEFLKKKYHLCQYIKYIEILSELLECETQEKSIARLHKFQLKKSEYELMVERFKKKFPEEVEEIKFLQNLYSEYNKIYKIDKKRMKKEPNGDVYFNILNTILQSGYSMEEYCSVYGGYSIKQLKKLVSEIRYIYPTLCEEFEKKCMHSSSLFHLYIKRLVRIMEITPDFDTFDYYYYTKLNPFDFIAICQKVLSVDEFENSKNLISKIRRIALSATNSFDMMADLNGTTVIKDREIRREEKEIIIDYLKSNRFPSVAYKTALKKFVAGDSRLVNYVNPPQKTKK